MLLVALWSGQQLTDNYLRLKGSYIVEQRFKQDTKEKVPSSKFQTPKNANIFVLLKEWGIICRRDLKKNNKKPTVRPHFRRSQWTSAEEKCRRSRKCINRRDAKAQGFAGKCSSHVVFSCATLRPCALAVNLRTLLTHLRRPLFRKQQINRRSFNNHYIGRCIKLSEWRF